MIAPWVLACAFAATAAGAPPTPADLRIQAVTTHSATVAWRSSGRARRLELQHRPGSDTTWQQNRLDGELRHLRIRDLPTGTSFAVRIRACGGGCSAWSKSREQTTLLAPFGGPHPDPGCQILPPDDAFHLDVTGLDPAENSDAVIDRILADGGGSLHPDFGSNPDYGIPYVVVPAGQTRVPVQIRAYPNESDHDRRPLPPAAPVEGHGAGDSHLLVVERDGDDPDADCELTELYRARYRGGPHNQWSADQVSAFDLGLPLPQRPDGWTSADAAGLPILPGLVRFEEVKAGLIDHAIRITFERTRAAYLAPASHFASDSCNASRPPMGMRLRLSATYPIAAMSTDAKVVAEALKTYGAIVADNGSNFYISGSTDGRWDDEALNDLKAIPGDAFEVVEAGADLSVSGDC